MSGDSNNGILRLLLSLKPRWWLRSTRRNGELREGWMGWEAMKRLVFVRKDRVGWKGGLKTQKMSDLCSEKDIV